MAEKEDAPKEIVGYRQQPGKLPFSRPGSGGKGKFSVKKTSLSLDERKKKLAELKKKTKCSACGERGHWAGD